MIQSEMSNSSEAITFSVISVICLLACLSMISIEVQEGCPSLHSSYIKSIMKEHCIVLVTSELVVIYRDRGITDINISNPKLTETEKG